MRKVLGLLAICSLLTMPVAHAGSVWEMAESTHYGTKASGMFGRGLLNVLTSPLDLIVQTVEKTQDGPPLIGTLTGLGSGLGCTALRAGSGIVDVATFWAPNFNGFVIGRDYSNCLDKGSSMNTGYAQNNYDDYASSAVSTPVDTYRSSAVVPASNAQPLQASVMNQTPQAEASASSTTANHMQYVKGSKPAAAAVYTEEKTQQENRMKYVK